VTQSQLATVDVAPTVGPTRAERDALDLLRVVWDYQETRRLGWVSIVQLQEEAGLPWPRFTPALDLLLGSPRIRQTPSGGLEYTW
jgi:hypothetical protein